MVASIRGMPMRGEGDGAPSRRGRVVTAGGRSASGKADPYGGDGVEGCPTTKKRSVTGVRRSRKYDYVPSTVRKFMVTGISEPRRFRSLPIMNEVPVPFRRKNKKYLHVNSTISEFMRTGLRKPRRLPKLPSPCNFDTWKASASSSRKFKHVASRVSQFLKTGISEPRRFRSVPVVPEEVHIPVINNKKQFSHVQSVVQGYIKTGVLPAKRKTPSLPMEEPVFQKNKYRAGSKPSKQPPRNGFKSSTKVGNGTVQMFLESLKTERVEDVIANLVRCLRNVNAESQPSEAGSELTIDIETKFPNVYDLLNSKDPFDLVYALGLGYHYKFITDYGGECENSKPERMILDSGHYANLSCEQSSHSRFQTCIARYSGGHWLGTRRYLPPSSISCQVS